MGASVDRHQRCGALNFRGHLMNYKALSFFTLLSVVCVVPLPEAVASDTARAATPAQVRDIEAAVLKSRRAFRSGHIRIHHVLTDHRPGADPKQSDADEDIETVFDGSRVRENLTAKGVRRSIAIGDQYLYFYSNQR